MDEICPNCNHPIPQGSAFCPECGYKVPAPEAPVTALNGESTDATPSAPAPAWNEPSPNSVYNAGNGYNPETEGDVSKDGYAVASLVTAIIGTLTCCCGFMLPFQIASLIFGIIGCKSQKKGVAIAGIVISAICLLIAVIGFIYLVSIGSLSEEFFDEFSKAFENGLEQGMYY